MQRRSSAKRRRKTHASPLMSVVIVAVALLLFVITVGMGVYLMMGEEALKPAALASSSQPSKPHQSSSQPGSAPASSSSQAVSSSSVVSVSSSDSQAPQESSQSQETSSQPASSQASDKFDPAIMGSSGFANISEYRKINTDVKGWINIPGTNINYPVLHDSRVFVNSAVPHFYLDKDVYKQQSRDGVIYADPAAAFGSADSITRNTVIYGHNWTNYSANPRIGNAGDVMFAQLNAYHHLNFAKSHPYIYYSTAEQEMAWVIFAAFYTDVNFNYILPNPDNNTFASIINGAKARSRHIYDIPVSTSDKIITLSTCTRAYGKSDRQRFVVMARLLRPGETFVPINITANPNPVLPVL